MISLALLASIYLSVKSELSEISTAKHQSSVVVKTIPLDKQNVTEWKEFTGRFVASEFIEVRPKVEGYINEIYFKDGSLVKEGDLLFKIDQKHFVASLNAQQAKLKKAQAALEEARVLASRAEALSKTGALSIEEIELRQINYLKAKAEVEQSAASVVQAELELSYTDVRAPTSGRVSKRFLDKGNLATKASVLTTLVNNSPIYLEFTASELDYLAFQRLAQKGVRQSGRNKAHEVIFKLSDEDKFMHHGKLNFVDNSLDMSTGTVLGRAEIENDSGLFIPGMFAKVKLKSSEEYVATVVPDDSIHSQQTDFFVWLSIDNIAKKEKVTLGPLIGNQRVVYGDLPSDALLVIGAPTTLRDGAVISSKKEI